MRLINFKTRIMLTVMLAVSMGGFAQFGGGDGSQGNPYQISTAAQLADLATNVNSGTTYSGVYFILNNDIDLNIAPHNTGTGWMPIGWYDGFADIEYPFMGNFNGNNKKITNLFIDDNSRNCAGLFGIINGGSIENLGVENVNINGGHDVGGVVGYIYNNCTINN